MTSRLEHALRLAADGFYIFPLKPNAKTPAHKGWQAEATRDEMTIRGWFGSGNYNVGIFTGKFGDDGGALVVVDVDTKKEKDGRAALLKLELEGFDLPDTRVHTTPTGGKHLLFKHSTGTKNRAGLLPGLDVRSLGGFVVGPGSTVARGDYVGMAGTVAPVPEWLFDRIGRRSEPVAADGPVVVSSDNAARRAQEFLERYAPLAIQGSGGDETTYKVAARLKDIGCAEADALALMLDHWNDRCSPPWNPDDLRTKVRNAYAYGTLPPGTAAPENDFDPVPAQEHLVSPIDDKLQMSPNGNIFHPFDELNREFAYVVVEGKDHILWEKKNRKLIHMDINAFHRRLAAKKITVGKKSSPITREWIEWEGRRSYDDIVFMPQQTAPEGSYNLWRGFAVEPSDGPNDGLQMWLDHLKANVCNGDTGLFHWLLGWFAHLVQRPWEKPLVALVLKGEKGVGKNVAIGHVGALLGCHYMLTAKERYLLSNFNGHLENLLLFVLDEAFWSGHKAAEGTLKDLVTGDHHVIEHKGEKPYRVDNKARIVVIGNEDWLVPASFDERRYAVFNVGSGRKQDTAYFKEMQRCMDAGGYGALLRYLMDYKIVTDVNRAPGTEGLLDQKLASLEPFQQWWLSCLTEGRLVLSDFAGEWPDVAECDRLRSAFRRWAKERNVRGRLADDRTIGRELAKLGVKHGKKAVGYVYEIPPLAEARAAWDKHIGHKMGWPE